MSALQDSQVQPIRTHSVDIFDISVVVNSNITSFFLIYYSNDTGKYKLFSRAVFWHTKIKTTGNRAEGFIIIKFVAPGASTPIIIIFNGTLHA